MGKVVRILNNQLHALTQVGGRRMFSFFGGGVRRGGVRAVQEGSTDARMCVCVCVCCVNLCCVAGRCPDPSLSWCRAQAPSPQSTSPPRPAPRRPAPQIDAWTDDLAAQLAALSASKEGA